MGNLRRVYGQEAAEMNFDMQQSRKTYVMQMSRAKRKRLSRQGFGMYDYGAENDWGREQDKAWKIEAKKRRKKVIAEYKAKDKNKRIWKRAFKKMSPEEQKAEMVKVRASNAQKYLDRKEASKASSLRSARIHSKNYGWEERLGRKLSDEEVMSYAQTPFDEQGNRNWSPERNNDMNKREQNSMANAYEPGLIATQNPYNTQATRDVAEGKSGVVGNVKAGESVYNPKSKTRTAVDKAVNTRRKAQISQKRERGLDRAKSRLF